MSYERIEVEPISPAVGALVRGADLADAGDNRMVDEIHRAFLEHQVLFFEDQHLTPEEHKAFARRFGSLNIHPFVGALPDHPEIIEVLKDVEDTQNFGGLWHTDLTFLEEPPLGSILYALEVPKVGGDTLFASLYRAYETLSGGLRKTLDGLTAIHSAVDVYGPQQYSGSRAGRSMRMDQTEEALAEVEHPLVRTHPETGRKALYLGGGYLRRFKGWTAAESKPLLDYLAKHATREDNTCRFRWKKHAVAFWDNRCALHYALNDYHGQRRRMHRVTVNGDRPA